MNSSIPLNDGLNLIMTAWNIMGDISFSFGEGMEFSLQTLFFAIAFFNLLGIFIYKIWGD